MFKVLLLISFAFTSIIVSAKCPTNLECPYKNGQCCEDLSTCCPSGYRCDPKRSGYCISADEYIRFPVKSKSVNKVDKALFTCPDGCTQCASGSTCCVQSSGRYGCCPLPDATCCSDYVHCCPYGYTCNAQNYCTRSANQITQKLVGTTPAKQAPVIEDDIVSFNLGDIYCGDERTCPEGSTCCATPDGEYNCCSFPGASCCNDGIHCCPQGFTCDSEKQECRRNSERVAMQHKFPAKKSLPPANIKEECKKQPIDEKPKVVECGTDKQYFCLDGETCCLISPGVYGCCPMVEAVCCSDKKHCCPHGATCDVAHGTCLSSSGEKVQMRAHKPANVHKEYPEPKTNQKCPDGKTECADNNTCCELTSGQGYRCCKFKDAICCEDGLHCCPTGFTCSAGGLCNNATVKATESKPMTLYKPMYKECKDGSECPSYSTCCKLNNGKYGCCPIPDATCCRDGVHCCPNHMRCDDGHCHHGDIRIPATKKFQSIQSNQDVSCNDGNACSENSTCCHSEDGSTACCPAPSAVCCSNGKHCCPSGHVCSEGGCVKANKQIEAYQLTTKLVSLESVRCPDHVSECPDGSTCCKLSSGQWGCCPLPKATCCSDGVHCCPNGYTCGSGGYCTKGSEVIKASIKNAAINNLKSVACPDGTSQCPDGSTCCKLSSGQYGCCPLPKATCCSDGVHCCPNGYSCAGGGYCTKGNDVIKASLKTKAISLRDVACPDGQSQCPSGNTCCKLSSGGYGCCPLPKATCCSDGVHCCPNGYTCGQGTCMKGNEIIQASTKTFAFQLKSVTCPDSVSNCPDGNTCCKLSSGEWGCCPVKDAVCCSDGVHCCPSGYTCSKGFCTQSLTKEANKIVIAQLRSVECPDGMSECPSGNTCCKLSSGQWGCCPLPKATCCSDGVHCCPNGYNCNSG
uniref:Granulins domain-containing protein n=2 Tax=Clytia hemisphaerica TaxID=252671 RepID=A0A7M5U4A6_9CNID